MNLDKLIDTSHDRFLQILNGFPTLDELKLNGAGKLSKSNIQQELSVALYTYKNNVTLMAIQGAFALLSSGMRLEF